ncbi:Protein kinase domain-containing protein 17 [Elsinoe fawcettii]|nr:Protein kinase domain-containing protein 17 [Elsinoe fawcettii]
MSPGTPDWRSSLSFSERLQSILRVQIAQAHRDKTSATEAQARAKAVENEIFKTATSRDLYELLIGNHIRNLESVAVAGVALQEADLSDDVDQMLSGGVTIGDYVNAQHYKDGQSSLIYKAKSLKHCPTRDNVWKGGLMALKATHPATMTPPHDSKREARLLTLAASKNVVPLFDTFNAKGGQFVLVFPFLPIDLDELLRRGTIPEARGKAIIKDVLSALVHVHGMGMIHRDIKPSNILLKHANGQAWLADFGIAWSRDDPASESEDRKILDVGTTCYRPPELMFGNEKYGHSLDMWALGCVAAQIFDLGSRTLFDSGELGSDLALIKSIFETLGTPNLKVWPEATDYPDWGKMAFKEYPGKSWQDILPQASIEAQDFVSRL